MKKNFGVKLGLVHERAYSSTYDKILIVFWAPEEVTAKSLTIRAVSTDGNTEEVVAQILRDQKGFNVGNLQYELVSNEGETSAQVIQTLYTTFDGTIMIPETIEYEGKSYSVTAIDDYVFLFSSLDAVILPNSLKKIGAAAFNHRSGFKSIKLPDALTSIDEFAFASNLNLQTVQIGESLRNIGKDAFKFCENLEAVYIRDLRHWLNINFSNESANPLWAGNASLFLNGELVTNLNIPGDVSIIPFASFAHCKSIESVTFEDGVTEIRRKAFMGCPNLRNIIIPASMTLIDKFSFSSCQKLNRIDCYATVPPSMEIGYDGDAFDKSFAFYNSNPDNIVLHVPKGSYSAYNSAPGWNRFGVIIDDLTSGIDDVRLINDACATREIYNLQGVFINNNPDNLVPGIYIIRQGNKANKVVVK